MTKTGLRAALIGLLLLAGPGTALAAPMESYPERDAARQTAQTLTLKQFLDRCGQDIHFCRGVVDVLRDSPAPDDGACMPMLTPTSEATAKVIDVLSGALQDHPDWADQEAVGNVYTAMAVLWPCQDE